MSNITYYKIFCNSENKFVDVYREENEPQPAYCVNDLRHTIDQTKTQVIETKELDNGLVTLYNWRIYCNEDNRYEYTWLEYYELPPDYCSKYHKHSVDKSNVQLVKKKITNNFEINEEPISTQNKFRFDYFSFVPVANVITEYTVKFNYPISPLKFKINFKDSNVGDQLTAIISPKTLISKTSTSVAQNTNTINVYDSTLFVIGYYIFIENDNYGIILDIDHTTKTITFENSTTKTYIIDTNISMEGVFINNIEIPKNMKTFTCGDAKIGVITYLPTQTELLIQYNNKENYDKYFSFYIEYLY